MNYKVKYDAALKRARELSKTVTGANYEYIFPELKESEDELTWLTKYIEEEAYSLSMDIRDNEDRLKLKKLQRSLAWLKKQGEKKPNGWHSEDEQNLNATLSYIDDEYLRRWLKDIIHAKYEQCVDDNMKEQKVEPKFKAGDWIIGNEGIFKISQYDDDGGYNLTDTTGCVVHFVSPDYVESNFYLWTIADAKDGDVLCYETKDDFRIFIYKEGHIHYHCCYSNEYLTPVESFFVLQKHQLCYIHPTTKEQRELLFAKMRESGYEWDAQRKELKKIEHKTLNPDIDFEYYVKLFKQDFKL